jgi:hypothetical protein
MGALGNDNKRFFSFMVQPKIQLQLVLAYGTKKSPLLNEDSVF